MFQWRCLRMGTLLFTALRIARAKHTYNQRYEKILMRWGSGLFWAYTTQCMTGLLLGISYTPLFDTGMLAVIFLWWETGYGSTAVRLHSEVANILFLILYLHVFTKLWTSLDNSDATSHVSWISGAIVLLLTYGAGVTGAIMPCSTLSEVTATIVGSALASLVYVKFDFLETILVPGAALNEEAIWRTFVIHAVVPLAGLCLGLVHMVTLHVHKYSAGGGFERLTGLPRMRESRRWGYGNRYWTRASGTWIRILLVIMLARISNELFALATQVVSYGFMNNEYWPINEHIDFVLIIPHWYLRPLMGALVTIPHHYLGFIYIGVFFILILTTPWNYEISDDSMWANLDDASIEGKTTARWDLIHAMIALNCFLSAVFTTAIIPTGKFFIALGSMDGLVYTYWALIIYMTGAAQIAYYINRKGNSVMGA